MGVGRDLIGPVQEPLGDDVRLEEVVSLPG